MRRGRVENRIKGFLGKPKHVSAVRVIAKPHRIKASHRRRGNLASGHRFYILNNPLAGTDPTGYAACDGDGPCDPTASTGTRIKGAISAESLAATGGSISILANDSGQKANGATSQSIQASNLMRLPLTSNLNNTSSDNRPIYCGANGVDSGAPGPQMQGVTQNWADWADEHQDAFMKAQLPEETYNAWKFVAGPINGAIVDASHGRYRNAALQGAMYVIPETKLGGELVERVVGPIAADLADSLGVKLVHKNSLQYVGDTHVYGIYASDGTIYKIGESAQGVRLSDGASIRAEKQVRQLLRDTGDQFVSKILKTFNNKADARAYETKLIERFRNFFGDDALPGNSTNR